ncbi:MAG: CatB-related O-acetyltransferase [Clostridia bacterium]
MKNLVKKTFFMIKLMGKHVHFCSRSTLGKKNIFEGNNYIGYNTAFNGEIGYGSYIGDNCQIDASIKRFVSIASGVKVVSGNHPTSVFVSTYPSFYSNSCKFRPHFVNAQKFDEYTYADEKNKHSIVIGNDVWVATDALILSGVSVGDGAIVAAGSLVTKDVPPYAVVGGIPAKVIKYRFNEEQIKALLEIKWWDRPIEWIKENADAFDDIEKFIEGNY